MSDPTVFLFDGSNLLHAGGFAERDALVDLLASFVAGRGARGVVVFDGTGVEREVGLLAVRFAPDADTLLERLAAELRASEDVVLVSSDQGIRLTIGQDVRATGSAAFLRELDLPSHRDAHASRVADRLDPSTRARLERLRRGQ
jgi:predicted RNA-binding protein with PIN domain